MAQTTILCTTCTSTVPWGPHCPECGAYLEFAGDPPWQPGPPEVATVGSADTIEADDCEDVIEDVIEDTTDIVVADPAQSRHTARTQSLAGSIGALVVGALVTPALWWATGAAIGVASAVMFVTWAVVLWPRRATVVPPEPALDEAPSTTETLLVTAPAMTVPTSAEVVARPPQALEQRTFEATRPLITRAPEGDVPCSACRRTNTAERVYCLWCGTPMEGTVLGPATMSPVDGANRPPQDKQSRRRRRPNRSWRPVILTLTLAGVLLGSIIFALFGPGAFQFRFGITNVYQAINQFIDPYVGDQADIADVTANSTLRGTNPRDAAGADAANFWASAPSISQGAGSELTFTLTDPYTINRMVILPGIQNRLFDVRSVATPKDITLTFDDGTSVSDQLSLVQNAEDLQQLVRFPKVTTRTIRLTIDSVYPPRKPADSSLAEVAISGVRFLAPPAPPRFINLPNDIQPRTSLPGTTS